MRRTETPLVVHEAVDLQGLNVQEINIWEYHGISGNYAGSQDFISDHIGQLSFDISKVC